jgi:ribulose-5-phosphate 4-epimerase/fuculose-1-phosphate aldolase
MKPKSSGTSGNAIDRLRSTYRYLLRKRVDTEINGTDLSTKVRDALVTPALREEMAKDLEYAARLGLSVGKLSEASLHIQANQYLVTRRDCSFSNLMEDDFILVSPGSVLNKSLTPHYWNWHQKVYLSNPRARALLLGQPAEVMALASRDELPADHVMKDAAKRIGKVLLSPPDAGQIGKAAAEANLIVVPGMGVLSWADTLLDAVENLSVINHWSAITLMAKD